MPSIRNDATLWYNVGDFGTAGFAVPNWSDDEFTLNPTIWNLVDTMGRNLFAVMNHADADLRSPPSINTLRRVHKLILRARQLIGSKVVAENAPLLEPSHATPVPRVFRVYPCAYHKVRNSWLNDWATYAFIALAEAMQHTENRRPFDISANFGGLVGQYLTRIYTSMSVDLFGIPRSEADQPGFTLSEAQLGSYAPSKFFTPTEMVDTVAPFGFVFTEDTLRPIADGLLVTDLPALGPYPPAMNVVGAGSVASAAASSGGAGGSASTGTAAVPAFPPPPSS